MKAIGLIGGQVGDLVMATAAARQFKIQYPGSHLTFSMIKRYGHVKDLFIGNPDIDDVHVWDSDLDWPLKSDLDYCRSIEADVVFNPFPSHTRPDWYNHLHYVEETCLMMGFGKPSDLQCSLGYRPNKIPGLDRIITMSMFASGNQPTKTLSSEDRERLVKSIRSLGFTVIQLGSSDIDIQGAAKLNSDIFTAVDYLTSSRLHVTIDTAFSWIASAYQHPVVGLYAVNYADMFQDRVVSHNPFNPKAIYHNAQRINDISIEAIISSIKDIV